jgi:integrase
MPKPRRKPWPPDPNQNASRKPGTVQGVLCLRRVEIVALRWRHVDLKRGQLTIAESAEQTKAGVRYKPPKSGKGRLATLPAMPVESLRLHRVEQAQDLLRLGVRQGEGTFFYAREDGDPIQPRTLTQTWRKIAASGDLPKIGLHDLRHAHATHMLAKGVHPKVASERLSHSRVSIALDLYSHVVPGMQEAAVARVDEALSQALERRPRSVGQQSGSKQGLQPTCKSADFAMISVLWRGGRAVECTALERRCSLIKTVT